MGEEFTISASFTDSATVTHVTQATSGVGTVGGGDSVVETTETLRNFSLTTDANTDCRSGFLAATVSGGTIDAYVTNNALTRSVLGNGATADECDNSGRLVGVMNLTAPVVVTSETVQVLFNFNLTNAGAQFFGTPNSNTVAESGSGPFSGSFTIINN